MSIVDSRNRSLLVAAIVVVLVLVAGGGYLLGKRGASTAASASPTIAVPTSPTPTPTPTSAPTSAASVTPEPATQLLPDGRYFVDPRKVIYQDADPFLRFDLAYYLTDQAAADAAAAHGDESPPPNGYYIVNDNPMLRSIFVSPTVVVRYIPAGACCSLKPSTFDAFTAHLNGTAPTDYADWSAWWWITIKGQMIVKISQQYLP
jgi:hypothetical protein